MAPSRPSSIASLVAVMALLTACASPGDPGASPSDVGDGPSERTSVGSPTVAPPTPPAGGDTIAVPDLSGATIDCGAIDEPCAPGDDPALDRLWSACEEGDGGACDRLYYDAPFDTRYEQFGNTCGDRNARVPCPERLS